MTFTPCMAQAVLYTKKLAPAIASVIEFGNQRYTAWSVAPADSTVDFYHRAGIVQYLALDVNTRMSAIVADLNSPVDLPPVDLVTNNGTGEHIFDQASVFRNAHDLCAVGGFMIHCLPMTPWVNHGFYNYNPILFRDIAAANGYKVHWLSLCSRFEMGWNISSEAWPFVEKRPTELIDAMRSINGEIMICVIWQKLLDGRFRTPIQGKYLKDVEGA